MILVAINQRKKTRNKTAFKRNAFQVKNNNNMQLEVKQTNKKR